MDISIYTHPGFRLAFSESAPAGSTYGPLLQLLAPQVTDAADWQNILWDTPRRLFGFA